MEMESLKPPSRALPSLETGNGTSAGGLSRPTSRALPPLSQNKPPSVRTIAAEEPDFLNETVRNRSTARKKRRDRNVPRDLPLASVDSQVLNSEHESTYGDQPARTAKKAGRTRTSRSILKDSGSKSRISTVDIPDSGPVLSAMINEDDVLPVDHLDSHITMTTLPGVAGSGGASQPQNKVYVQTTTGFKSHTKEWLATQQSLAANKVDDLEGDIYIARTSQVSLSFHRGFIFLAFALHGILAGISVWQVVFPFSLNNFGETNFIEQYAPLAQPIQTTYFILLAYCLISAMDRCNLGGPGRNIFFRLIKFEPTAWLFAIYFLAFVINVGMGGVDFWLGRISPILIRTGETAPDAYFNADPTGGIRTWLILNVLRAVFAILGWFIISVRPKQDKTAEELTPENS